VDNGLWPSVHVPLPSNLVQSENLDRPDCCVCHFRFQWSERICLGWKKLFFLHGVKCVGWDLALASMQLPILAERGSESSFAVSVIRRTLPSWVGEKWKVLLWGEWSLQTTAASSTPSGMILDICCTAQEMILRMMGLLIVLFDMCTDMWWSITEIRLMSSDR
jgi:hypothetical protein